MMKQSTYTWDLVQALKPFCKPPPNPELLRAPLIVKSEGLAFKITIINKSLLFNPFQPGVIFHIETVKVQIKPDFYIECYTGPKWVKREYFQPKILNLIS